MALVYDANGNLVDDQAPRFGLAAASRERAQQPLVPPAVDPADTRLAAARETRDRRRANNAVLAQDRENLAGLTGATQAPATTLPAQSLEAINQGIQATLDANRAPAPIAGERGNYNLANTSAVDAQGNISSTLRQPDNVIEGGYGQFGGGRAQSYLSQFSGAPRRDPFAITDQMRIERQLVSNNPFERRAARDLLANKQALALDAGATQRTGMQLTAEQLRARESGLAAVQAAEAAAAGRQQAAQVAGQFDLLTAQTAAEGRVEAAQASTNTGANSLAQIRAEQVARQLAVAKAAEEAGDLAGRDRALGISQGTPGRVQIDRLGNPIGISTGTGVRPLTPDEIAALQGASAQYNVRSQ